MTTATTATLDEASIVTDVISGAFSTDPTWAWAIPDLSARSILWALFINNALRYPYVLRTPNFEAVSVWIPPNSDELTPEDEDKLPGLMQDLVGERADELLELFQLFDDAHPHGEPHYYLSFLATHNDHRGHGFGMKLLREGLARIDAENMPAYLESSNPINNDRYKSVGFVPVTSFQAPGNGPTVTCMWRDKSVT